MTWTKILIVDDVHQSLVHGLIAQNFDVFYRPEIQKSEVMDILNSHDFEGLVVRSKFFLDADFFSNCGNLKWVARAGAGMDNIDVDAAQSAGVVLMNSGNANSDAVAEQTMAMLLGICTKLMIANSQVKQFVWDREGNRGFELKGKTVGIIGYGNTGMAVAEKLQGFGVHVLAYDKYKSEFSDNKVTEVDLATILDKSDVITLHIPLTDETRFFVDFSFLNSLKKPVILLNLSRGQIVDIESVNQFLESGKLIGFCADVLPVEPPKNSNEIDFKKLQKLFSFENVIVSPHVGGWTVESYEKISQFLLSNILNYYKL